MRLTKKVFTDLAIFMIGFGLIMGVVFPLFVNIIGVPQEYIDLGFIIACLIAGFLVGLVNILLTKLIVGKRLKLLSDRMKYVNSRLAKTSDIDAQTCLDNCIIPVDSEDVIGESSQSFNELVKSFLVSFESEFSIRNFTEIFTNELDLEKLSDKALHHLMDYTGSSAGLVLIDKGGKIDVSSSYLIKEPGKIIDMEIVHRSFTTGKRVILGFTEDIVIETGLISFKPKAILLEPINYKGSVLGLIMLASTMSFDQEKLDKLNVYTHGLSLGLHNAITHDKLEQIAILDPLTKVFNRRYGMERLRDEYNHSIQSNSPLGILMLDIDHFKKVNDTYGHIIGDQVLINITKILKQTLRKGDTLIRYGGEEFLVVLPGAAQTELKKIAEQIRRFIEENSIKYHNQDIKVTISIGGVSHPEYEINDLNDLIKGADEGLYISKENGRNQITIV